MSNMKPDYEVKLLLNPCVVLRTGTELKDTVQSAFPDPLTTRNMSVQFLDTDGLELYRAGWSARIRKVEQKPGLELTYKKRYIIENGDIDAALAMAKQDGFDADTSKFKAQVEWGHEKKTLSISRQKTVATPQSLMSGMDLPGEVDSRNLLIAEAPSKFNNSKFDQWGTSTLAVSRIFGPVSVRRYSGSWNGNPLHVEVWSIRKPVGTELEYIVEASFKTESRQIAAQEQGNLIGFLQREGWFLPGDALKTQLIMERY